MNPETAAPPRDLTAAPPDRGRDGLWREAPPYFDDLRLGDAMESSGRTVTEYDVVSFASLTGDWHPQHADAAWAAQSPFGRRVAHGMLVISYAIGLLPIDPRVVMALRSIDGAVLKRPVGLGDTIRVQAKVAGLRPLGDQAGLVTLAVRILNQDGELAARMEIVVLWRRQAQASESPAGQASEVAAAEPSGAAGGPTSSEDELSPIQDGRVIA